MLVAPCNPLTYRRTCVEDDDGLPYWILLASNHKTRSVGRKREKDETRKEDHPRRL